MRGLTLVYGRTMRVNGTHRWNFLGVEARPPLQVVGEEPRRLPAWEDWRISQVHKI